MMNLNQLGFSTANLNYQNGVRNVVVEAQSAQNPAIFKTGCQLMSQSEGLR
jgi:hypothetical protein